MAIKVPSEVSMKMRDWPKMLSRLRLRVYVLDKLLELHLFLFIP